MECRNAKDNPFLDAALAATANVIMCSDKVLLVLHPYKAIEVLNLQDFSQKYLCPQSLQTALAGLFQPSNKHPAQ